MYKIAVVGATGMVGQEVLKVLERRNFPVAELRCFASASSEGTHLSFCGQELALRLLHPDCFEGIDFAIFCSSKDISKMYAPLAMQAGAIVIDKSSAFRLDPDVPLIIPEVNGHLLKTHRGLIASPNCTAIIMLMAVAPLHRQFHVERIVASTYQAVSGGGKKMLQQLHDETRNYLENPSASAGDLAFNVFLHEAGMHSNCYGDEEMKLIAETRKILEESELNVTATCVRVPVMRAHAESLNIQFRNPIDRQRAVETLSKAPGVKILEDWKANRFPMPTDASEQDQIFCGRIREDLSQKNTIDLWVVGDQLLKGAALNAVQIAEHLSALNL